MTILKKLISKFIDWDLREILKESLLNSKVIFLKI